MAGKPGRPRSKLKYEAPLTLAKDRLAAAFPDLVEAMLDVALGRTFVEKWEPAGIVTRKGPLLNKQDASMRLIEKEKEPAFDPEGDSQSQGEPLPFRRPAVEGDGVWLDPKDKPLSVDVLVYPHLPANELVLVSQVPIPPDPKMLMYLWDRLEGKPMQAVELSGQDGEAIRHAVTIYLPSNGREARPDGDPAPGGTPE